MGWVVYITYKSSAGAKREEFRTGIRATAEREYARWLKHPDRFENLQLVQETKDRATGRTRASVIQKTQGYVFDDAIPF